MGEIVAMPASAWPMVARDDEFGRALAALDDRSASRGVVLVGGGGVGKSTMARWLAEKLRSEGRTVRFVLGTRTGRAVPLGAFFRSVTVDASHQPAMMLAAAHRTLAQEENLALIVDDAQLLDPLSATLVHQLAVGGSTQLIVAVCSAEVVPDAVTALWKEQLLVRLDVQAFTRAQTGELARAVLGGTVESRLVDELYGRTAGDLLLLRGLLSAGRQSGALVCTETGWQLRGSLRGDDALRELVEFRLQSLTAEELQVIEVIAAAEVLDWDVLRAVCDPDAVARLEQRGLVQLLPDASRLVARLHHPIIGEVALQRAGLVRTQQINSLLVQHISRHVTSSALPDDRGRIRLAQWMMRSDLPPDLDVIIDAAGSAIAMSNMVAGEELARFAFDRGGGLPAALELAEAMSWQGRDDEAEAILTAFIPDDAEEPLTGRWGCLRAGNLFWGSRRTDTAQLVLADVRDRVDSTGVVGLVEAMKGLFALFSGDLSTAITTGLAVCQSTVLPMATVWAAMSTALGLALSGRFSECHRVADTGFRTVAHGGSGPQWFAIGLAEVLALTAAGDLHAADRVWQRYSGPATGMREAGAIVKVISALADFGRGEMVLACQAFRDSLSAMAIGFPSCWPMPVWAWLAQAEAGRGNHDGAVMALKRCEEVNGPQVVVFAPELELARAWERASFRQTTAARRHAVRAGRVARRSGMNAVEMRALHTAVRFGDRSHATRLTELASTLCAPLPDVIAAHARALAERDGHLLDDVAEGFALIGAVALAADASAQAAREHARTGDRASELESSARVHVLAGDNRLWTPAIEAVAQPLPITDREREIAAMVAAGLSNRQIADWLSVSVRTVDGHLYRMFAKLNVQSRDQLARLVATGR